VVGLDQNEMEARHCRCHDFRFYVTLFPKCFSNFRSRHLFAIGLPTLYLTLADTYLPLHTAFPSSATRLTPSTRPRFLAQRASTGLGLNTPMRGCSSVVCFTRLNFTRPIEPSINGDAATTEKAFETSFGNESGPCSVAPH